MTLRKIFSSIPLERRDGVERYAGCKMFNRNYSELARLWLDAGTGPSEILINHQHLLDASKNYEIINCQHGYSYDKSMFPATVISEV